MVRSQYYVVIDSRGEIVYRADGLPLTLSLPEGAYTIEWKEVPVENPVVGYLVTQPLP